MSVRKGWLIFALVLIVSVELTVFSSFHYVREYGYAYGGTVVAVAKWDYVQAWVGVYITPIGGMANVEVILPNGTSVNLSASTPTSGEPYNFTLKLPRTGDFFGSEGIAVAEHLTLSPTDPLNFTIENNVGNVTNALDTLKATGFSHVDIYYIGIYGDAQVYIQGYGVAL